ncbi:MAG: 50S ribosomal protein L4 [Candidatus Kerfeldbacteria bacterium]|nr:50S ribosomal protein L4 [Candidatus Kerfeldbacteria bacterium]
MPQVKLYNQDGHVVGTADLADDLFGLKPDARVIRRAVEAQQRGSRPVVAHTKTRAEVRGGGKKPWRQKGTGRARQGSIRSPIWVGGGVAFGPRNTRNFTMRLNRKEKRKALLMGLSVKAGEQKIIVLDKLELAAIKTKQLAAILTKLQPKQRPTLLVQSAPNAAIIKSARNLPFVTTIAANSLNIVDVLRSDCVVLPMDSVKVIEKTYRTDRTKRDERDMARTTKRS